MNYENYTYTELTRIVDNSENQLARNLLEKTETEYGDKYDDLKEAFKQYSMAIVAEKVNEFSAAMEDEIKEGGYEFESYAEYLAESLGYELSDDKKLKEYLEYLVTDYDYVKKEPVYFIDEQLAKSLDDFIKDEWLRLGEILADPDYWHFEQVYAISDGRPYFSIAMFGEREFDISEALQEARDLIPVIDDKPLFTLEECKGLDTYISGDYMYIDNSYDGIGARINLDLLESAITQVKDEA